MRRHTMPQGCLCCGGLIETHIHLDKSRIIDRCAPEKGRDHNAMKRVSDVKHTMTVEDVHAARARDAGRLHQARHDAHAHACRGRPADRAARVRGRAGAGRRIQVGDRHRALRDAAGGPHQQSGHRRADGRKPEARREGRRRSAELRHRSCRARSAACSRWRASSMSTSTCISTPAHRRTIWTRCSCAS